ncbi:MAG: hypothetical protein QXL16_02555 [Candidatus Micrarchaeaceae archaeon]
MLQKSSDKWKSKIWYNLYSPKIFGEQVISEIPGGENNVVGRVIRLSLSWLTQKPEHSPMVIGLKVDEVSGNAAKTKVKFIGSIFSYLHSFVRRNTTPIYTRDVSKDKEGSQFVLKLLIVANGKLAESKRKDIRKKISGYIEEVSKAKTKEEIIKDLIEGNFQRGGIEKIKNIAKISRLELKMMEL